VEQCESCEATVTSFEQEAGTILGRMRKPVSRESYLDEAQCQVVVDRIRAMAPRPQGRPPTELFDGSASSDQAVPAQLREYQILERLVPGLA